MLTGRLGEFEHQQVADAIAATGDALRLLEAVRDVPPELLRLFSVASGFLEAWLAGDQSALVAAKEKLTGEDIIVVEEQARRRRAMLNAMRDEERFDLIRFVEKVPC